MARPEASAAVSVERFFQFSMLGLVASGYLAVAAPGYLDAPAVALTAAGLAIRGLMVWGVIRLEIPARAATAAALACGVFFALDWLFLSREFLMASVHLVFCLAVLKLLTARTARDHRVMGGVALMWLVWGAMLSAGVNFFLVLALFVVFAIAALTSGEIRGAMGGAASTARGGRKGFGRRLSLLTASIALGILALTAGLFLLLPRSAEAAWSGLFARRLHLPGFSDQVTLGEIGEIKTSSRPVMHIAILSREELGGLKWRGGALTDFDGRRWSNRVRGMRSIPGWKGHVVLEEAGERQGAGRRINYTVTLEAIGTDALFFAGVPEQVDLPSAGVLATGTGSYRLGSIPPPGFRYEAYSRMEDPPERTPPPPLDLEMAPAERARCLRLAALDPRIPELARGMAAGAATDLERARAIERRLGKDFGYTLDLPERAADDPLAEFLFTRKKGHCEYFASAMAVMLRTLGIPSRIATGFQSGVYNPLTGLWLVRASDAHSWVEAWIAGCGWVTFDPTPADPGAGRVAFLAAFGLYLDAAQTLWRDWVVTYDAGRQGALADRMEQRARGMGIHWFDSLNGMEAHWQTDAARYLRRFGPGVAITVGAGAGLWLLGPVVLRLVRTGRRVRRVRRGEAVVADATLLYDRMLRILKRRGYHKPPWFTPAEFSATLPRTGWGTLVAEFTATYNAMRFGGRTEDGPRLSSLLDELERQGSAR